MVGKIQLSKRKHPLYEENLENWDLYRDATKGGDNFITTDNLFSHRLEDEEDFNERLLRAYYLNYCEVIPTIYNNYIFKEHIERPPDAILAEFRNSADGKNTKITDFVKKVGFFSKVFGTMHVLVNIPTKEEQRVTKRQAKEQNLFPYCTLVYPSELVDWSIDKSGNFNWIVIESKYYRDEDPNVAREVETHYTLITREEWKIEDSKGNKADVGKGVPSNGKNEMGIVPLVTLYHQDIDDDKVGESLIKDVVYINRAILNWSSCIDEMIERQTFSQLIVPDDGTLAESSETGDDPLRRVSTSSVWTFNADSRHPPAFISPNTSNIVTVWNLVLDHVKEIFRIAGLVGSTEDMYSGSSGRSKQMGFLSVNSALANTANKYQKFENDISRMAYMLLGKDPASYKETRYPESFDISALEDEIASYFEIMQKNFSATLNKELMRNIARKSLPLATDDVKKLIEDEIEASDGYIENPIIEAAQAKASLGNEIVKDGNPNANDNKKTFTSRDRFKEKQTSHRPVDNK